MFYTKICSGEEAEDYFKKPGYWLVANVQQTIGWPEEQKVVWFRDIPILILPETQDQHPALAILCSKISQKTARETLSDFLNAWVWAREGRVEVLSWTGGSRPFRMGKGPMAQMLTKHFRIEYLPDPKDKAARLALSFYREAISLSHPAYSFLNYFRVINLKKKDGKAQKKWIRDHLDGLDDHDAKKRIEELKKLKLDISDYLYHSCRCAVAHADVNEVTVDPANIEDALRLRADLPIIKNLAEIFIETEMGVHRRRTIYREKPYVLFGLKARWGQDFDLLKAGLVPRKPVSFPESIALRLWNSSENVLGNLIVKKLEFDRARFLVHCQSADFKELRVLFGIDFAKNKILFDPTGSIACNDDSSLVAAKCQLGVARFLRAYWLNGILELWDIKRNQCLGYADAFVPVNIDMGRTIENFDAMIKKLEELVKSREGGTGGADELLTVR